MGALVEAQRIAEQVSPASRTPPNQMFLESAQYLGASRLDSTPNGLMELSINPRRSDGGINQNAFLSMSNGGSYWRGAAPHAVTLDGQPILPPGSTHESIVEVGELINDMADRGQGAAAMRDMMSIFDLADRAGITLVTRPQAFRSKAMATEELMQMYNAMGFQPMTLDPNSTARRNAAQTLSRYMVRRPLPMDEAARTEAIAQLRDFRKEPELFQEVAKRQAESLLPSVYGTEPDTSTSLERLAASMDAIQMRYGSRDWPGDAVVLDALTLEARTGNRARNPDTGRPITGLTDHEMDFLLDSYKAKEAADAATPNTSDIPSVRAEGAAQGQAEPLPPMPETPPYLANPPARRPLVPNSPQATLVSKVYNSLGPDVDQPLDFYLGVLDEARASDIPPVDALMAHMSDFTDAEALVSAYNAATDPRFANLTENDWILLGVDPLNRIRQLYSDSQ